MKGHRRRRLFKSVSLLLSPNLLRAFCLSPLLSGEFKALLPFFFGCVVIYISSSSQRQTSGKEEGGRGRKKKERKEIPADFDCRVFWLLILEGRL